MGKLNVLIIGLPLFAKRVAKDLSQFDSENNYTSLDTYYNKIDKLKYFLKIRNADIVYSINGTLTESKAINLALKLNKKIIMHWVGTDVIKSTKAFKNNNYNKNYIDKCIHWCEVDWIKEELKELGINASINNFAGFNINTAPIFNSSPFNVLTYISQHRAEYYGLNELKQLALNFPEIQFTVMGCHFDNNETPNITYLGWVDNGSELIEKSTVCIRYTEHDGLSNFVLEALAKGKYVLYNNPFPHVNYCENYDLLKQHLKELHNSFVNKELSVNMEGYHYIKTNFNKDHILNNLTNKLKKIVNES